MVHLAAMIRLAVLLGLLWGTSAMAGEPLVADLSKHLVAITTGFSGTDVLLFGAVDDYPDADVVVVVRGPNRTETVRRKDRVLGLWINNSTADIQNAPSFYRVAATRPLADIAPPDLLERHQIGLDTLDITVGTTDTATGAPAYRQALIRQKQAAGLYGENTRDIGFLSHRLFRTDMHFPANVPVGTYLVQVYLLRQGQVIGAQTTPLIVSKTGFGADLYDFAHHRALAYGLVSVLLAGLTGAGVARLFRR